MYDTSSTPTAAIRNVSGTARPAVAALACGLMFAAMLGAISAMDSPMACHTDSDRRRPPRGDAPAMAPPGTKDCLPRYYIAELIRFRMLFPPL